VTAPETNVAANALWAMPKLAIISNSALAVLVINCLALNFAPDPLLMHFNNWSLLQTTSSIYRQMD